MQVGTPIILGFETRQPVVAIGFDLLLTTATSAWARIKIVYRQVGAPDWILSAVWEAGVPYTTAYDPVTDTYYDIPNTNPLGVAVYIVGISNLAAGFYQVAVYVENSLGTIETNDLALNNLSLDSSSLHGEFTIYGDNRTPAHLVAKEVELRNLPVESYDFRIWRTTFDQTDVAWQDDIYLRGYAEIISRNQSYPNHALIGIRAMATDRLYGGRPRLTSIAVGEPLTVPVAARRYDTTCAGDDGIVTDFLAVNTVVVTGMRKVLVNAALPAPDGKYFWLVRMDSPGYADTGHLLTKHFLRVHTWENSGGQTYVYLQDNEAIPVDTELMLFHEDADPYLYRHTAWAVAKMLLQGSHGRITAAGIDWPAFAEWDAWNMAIKAATNQPRHLYDAVVDFNTDLWSLAMRTATTARGNLMRKGSKYSVWVDRAAIHQQVFGEGNSNNVTVNPIPRADRANILTTSFLDQSVNFEQKDISRDDVRDGEYPIVKTLPVQVGVVRESQINDLLDYMLLQNRYVGSMVSFDAGIDSIEVTVGNVFIVAGQAKDFSLSGRLITAYPNLFVQLDQPFTPEEASTYELTVWATDGTLYSWRGDLTGEAITSVPCPTGLPPGDYYEYPYVLAKVTAERMSYRCISINRHADTMEAALTGIEYRPEVYAND